MPITFESGDLFSTPNIVALAHGCNCAGAMGKGIAVTFRQRWPKMYAEYRRLCKDGSFILGDVFEWTDGNQVIFNLGTQQDWKTTANLAAIKKALLLMVENAESQGLKEVAMPRIGAGLGGLQWTEVRKVVETIASATNLTLRICDEFVAGKPMQVLPIK